MWFSDVFVHMWRYLQYRCIFEYVNAMQRNTLHGDDLPFFFCFFFFLKHKRKSLRKRAHVCKFPERFTNRTVAICLLF